MSLRGRVIEVPLLTVAQRRAMFELFDAHYLHATWAAFLRDLNEKQWAIVIEDETTGRLRGFSTQMLLKVAVGGDTARALFSGDTVIDRAAWGDQALARTWGRFALSLVDRFFPKPLYWFLISKGYKTYRFLPLFFHEFYPRWDDSTPEWAAKLIAACATHKFGAAFSAQTGLVIGGPKKDRLRPGVADLTPQRLGDPHVQFFAERNPGFTHGDELCCLAPISRDNFTEAAWRVIGAALRVGQEQTCPSPVG